MLFKMPAKAFAKFCDTPVAFFGKRAGDRDVKATVMCMVVEDTLTALGDAVAPTLERAFDITFAADEWLQRTPPQIGEWVGFVWAGEKLVGKVETVSHMPNGNYSLVATWSPERKGGPTWLQ